MKYGHVGQHKAVANRRPVRLIPDILVILGTVSLGAPLGAQTVQPGGTVSDQFEESELPQSEAVPSFRIEDTEAGIPEDDQPAFPVTRIVIDGAERFPEFDFDRFTSEWEGREVTLGQLNALAARITSSLAQSGYALSFAQVPEQTVEQGVVRLVIVPGTIDAIEIEFGEETLPVSRERIERAVQRRIAGLINDGAVRAADLERAVLGINDLSGVSVSVVITPSETVVGAATLRIFVETDPVNALIGTDNRLRSEFGREQIYGSAQVNSLLFVGDRVELTARAGYDVDAFTYFAGAYETPIGHSSARWRAYFSAASTEAQSGALGLLEFDGEEQTWGASIRYPVIRRRSHSLFAQARFDAIDTKSRLFDVVVVDDQIRSFSFGMTYDWASGDGALSLASVEFVQGIAGFGASRRGNPLRSRSAGTPDPTFARFRLYRDQPLPGGLRFRYDGEAQWMISSGGLLAAHECTFGGPSIGRAYDAGAVSGEECLFASGELARPTPVGRHIIEPYAFFDWGRAWQRGRLDPGQSRSEAAHSYGIGLRLFARFGLRADVQFAVPAERLFPGDDRDPRFFFTLSFQR